VNRELALARVNAELVLVERLLRAAVAADDELEADRAVEAAHRHLRDALALAAEYGRAA
jgi:hypothetical protein